MDLVTLHAHAEETTAVTAEALSATDTKTYRLGPLLITSVLLTDIGLQGACDLPAQQDYTAEDVSASLAAVGLPTSFGSQQRSSGARGKECSQSPPTSSPLTWQQLELLQGAAVHTPPTASSQARGSSQLGNRQGAGGAKGEQRRKGAEGGPAQPGALHSGACGDSAQGRCTRLAPQQQGQGQQPQGQGQQGMRPSCPAVQGSPSPPMPAEAMQWQELFAAPPGPHGPPPVFYFNLCSGVHQWQAPGCGFVPCWLKEEADSVRSAAALHAAAQQAPYQAAAPTGQGGAQHGLPQAAGEGGREAAARPGLLRPGGHRAGLVDLADLERTLLHGQEPDPGPGPGSAWPTHLAPQTPPPPWHQPPCVGPAAGWGMPPPSMQGQQGAQAGWGSPHLPASPMAAARSAPPGFPPQPAASAAMGPASAGGGRGAEAQAGGPQGAPVGPDQAQAVQGTEGVGPGPAVRGVGRLALEPGTKAYVRTLLPRNMFKYWLQRYSLFSKLDQGVQMDTEGWWSVTPEVLAQHQAGQCRAHSAGQVALDAMAGCAGNVIALAQLYPLVYAVEISAKRAAMAQHNAGVYGVGHKVEVLCADFFAAAPTLVADTIFVSPPWGGPSYKWCDAFQVLQPAEGMSFSIQHLLQVALGVVRRSTQGPAATSAAAAARASPSPLYVGGRHQLAAVEQSHLATALAQPAGGAEPAAAAGGGQDQVLQGVPGSRSRGVVALFLPRTTLLAELAALVPAGQVWQVERNYVNCRLKGITFYCYT
ncbi:hypothetical protein QJQ45_016365 [Haematococcus lacustris]|nr:hypothetical protein QJQ45_016365 [Haematococcus lacustris]